MSGIRFSRAAPIGVMAARFRAAHGIAREELVMTVLPGSRGGEVGACCRCSAQRSPLQPSRAFSRRVPTVATVADDGRGERRATGQGGRSCCAATEAKYDAFAASRAALAASGTVTLELALARLPMAVFYRMNRLTEALLDRVCGSAQYSLVNLLLEAPVVPELMGATLHAAQRLAAEAAALIGDERVRAAQRQGL